MLFILLKVKFIRAACIWNSQAFAATSIHRSPNTTRTISGQQRFCYLVTSCVLCFFVPFAFWILLLTLLSCQQQLLAAMELASSPPSSQILHFIVVNFRPFAIFFASQLVLSCYRFAFCVLCFGYCQACMWYSGSIREIGWKNHVAFF